MRGIRVSHRYAKSLLLLAIEKNKLEAVYADMSLIVKTCKENRDFVVFLRSPVIKSDKKIKIIDTIFAGQLSEMVSKFINIITNHRREPLLQEIAESFVLLYKNHLQITSAELISAVKLDEKTRQAVLEKIKDAFTANVVITERVDPNIIGGMIVRVGDKQFDASISRKLQQLKKDFSNNRYISQIN